ncbi:MAG: aldose 1-epimerase family protein [Bradyrhizobium sp.]|nr:aldose 1-epimerase family protein [Bradyrhizobium sp.]
MSSSLLSGVSQADLLRRVGSIEQVGGATRLRFAEGPARDMEMVQVETGAGLAFQILPDRGMGIGRATLCGVPLCWVSAVGDVAPWFYEPSGAAWLRTFGGGLLTSCGLTNLGAETRVDGIEVGLHGRLSHLPARNVSVSRDWVNGVHHVAVSGTVLDYCVMGPALEVKRTYSVTLGENVIHIHDEITNRGARPEPLFLLYHFNFGYPLFSETAELSIPSSIGVEARNPAYADEVADWRRFSAPTPGALERVFFHRLAAEQETAVIRLENTVGSHRLTMRMEFPTQAMTHLVQWKMMAEREYVLGLEPGTCFVSGRDDTLQRGDVKTLAAGATKVVDVAVAFALEPSMS